MDARPDRRGYPGPRQFFAEIAAGLIDCAERLALYHDAGGELHPAGSRIRKWFLDLSSTRGENIIVIPMGGVIVRPSPIIYQEMAAWSRMTGNRPSPWEAEQLMMMDRIYRAAVGDGKGKRREGQGLGEYCRGKDVAECRKVFGNQLERVCSTCPQ